MIVFWFVAILPWFTSSAFWFARIFSWVAASDSSRFWLPAIFAWFARIFSWFATTTEVPWSAWASWLSPFVISSMTASFDGTGDRVQAPVAANGRGLAASDSGVN